MFAAVRKDGCNSQQERFSRRFWTMVKFFHSL